MSLLRAFLLSMLGVAALFMMLAIGIWVSASDVLQRENALVSELLPELDVAFQLTAATAGLQSQGLFLLSTNDIDEVDNGRVQLEATIARSLNNINSLTTAEPSLRKQLEASISKVSRITTSLAYTKRLQFELRQRVSDEQQAVVDLLDAIERFVQREVTALTEQLYGISEQIAASELSALNDSESGQIFANRALEFEATNLTIQDFLFFAQDIALLKAVIEKVPLLTDATSLAASEQSRNLLLGGLVTRSIYLNDRASSASVLQQLRSLRNRLQHEHSLFELQKNIILYERILTSLGELMSEPIRSLLIVTDGLRDDTRYRVSSLAEQTLGGLKTYRVVLIGVSSIVLLMLATICYWLLYKNTVLPLLNITRQLDDVGSERFPTELKPYFVTELGTLSAAMLQLDEAQKGMLIKDLQLQGINENLKRANQELEQFAHVASHDLQEPLRKLQQFSDLLEEEYGESLDEDGKYFVTNIRSSAKRMSNLISETLAFSRAGNAKQKLEPVDLSDLLLQLRDEIELAVSEADAIVEIDALPTVLANRLGMAQLFRNLMTNALKYGKPDTTTRLGIRAIGTQEGSRHAYIIRVQDNGVGIDEKYLERIFQPFERFHTQGTRGTGLGLAICRKVCQAHHWELSVSSELDIGTTFEIRIPQSDLLAPAAG